MSNTYKKHHRISSKPEKAKNAKNTLKRVVQYIRKYLWKLSLSSILIILSIVVTVFATRLIGICIDRYIATFDFSGLKEICGLLLLLYFIAAMSMWLQGRLMIQTSQGVVAQIRKELFDKLQMLPLKYFDSKTHGELMSRVTNDVDIISTSLNSGFSQILQSIFTLITTLGMMFFLSPILTFVSLITLPVLMITTKQITKHSRKQFAKRQKVLGDLNGFIEEIISGQKVVKVFAKEEDQIEQFTLKNNKLLSASLKAEIYSGLLNPIFIALNNVTYTIIVVVGAFMILKNQAISLGIISNFIIYSKQISRPINELATQFNSIMSAIAGAERVFEVLDEDIEPNDISNAYDLKKVQGDVRFSGVSFSYVNNHKILKDINLEAKKGQTIALVGPTGAGKTTIINLLTRFYDVDVGKIFIDEYDIQTLKRASLRKAIGMVLQDTFLFTGSIKENIRYGNLNASDQEIIKAAKLANAHSFIEDLSEGYETVLADGGQNLSQGQRQMISIARVILKNPSILILDEATSNIDTRTEAKIQEAMENVMVGKTNFVIAHRLSTIKNADLIAVIQHGEIIEKGTHEELLEEKGYYYNLNKSQFGFKN